MSDTTHSPTSGATQSTAGAWATGFAMFAGAVLIVTGICQALAGIAALFRDQVYVATPNYIYSFDVTAWGWVHIILGAALALTGLGVIQGQTWARVVGILLASLSIIANFLFIPHYPIWSIVIIALDVAVIWALVRETRELA
ncbi:hypothetical protein GCM10010472_53500 [Pseudonocardia halophobica]|uniref:DUF7144 domain-containing protein n=1 Tax=Pseudonocardia halophobica TaxID=29401 RepID=A0A9W6L4N1_9PSEU|nr:hypothetical protein [Pseudonocardia halophobica]GLL12035.1 hypothetical protein GCM10017577_31760 [Pseudonocardia halophobica]